MKRRSGWFGPALVLAFASGCGVGAPPRGEARAAPAPPSAPAPESVVPPARAPAPPPSPAPAPARDGAPGAGDDDGPDGPLTAAERAAAIERLAAALKARYVFPDKAQKAQAALRARARRGDYAALSTGRAFARALSTHVNEVLKDAHFQVFYSAAVIPNDERQGELTPAERAREDAVGLSMNGGIERAERLAGNVGYLEVRSVGFLARGAEAAAAAMNFLAETDALVIDLRRNGGGDPAMVATLCAYFFRDSVHVNDIYDRVKNETRQYWTAGPGAPGRRYLDKEVYVLTSKQTASGAEELAYDLQQLKRATVVGERTWGGANPGEVLRLSDHLSAFVPHGRAINPVSKTNWEGTGVAPDVAVPAEDALRAAHARALERLIGAAKGPERKAMLEAQLKKVSAGAAGR